MEWIEWNGMNEWNGILNDGMECMNGMIRMELMMIWNH